MGEFSPKYYASDEGVRQCIYMGYGPGGAQRVREEILREMQWLLQERSGADRHLGIIGITPK